MRSEKEIREKLKQLRAIHNEQTMAGELWVEYGIRILELVWVLQSPESCPEGVSDYNGR